MSKTFQKPHKVNDRMLFFLAILSVAFSIISMNFYTGQTPISALTTLLNSQSLYIKYQEYFRENSIGNFSITKIPYILMMFFVKFILLYSYIFFAVHKIKLNFHKKLYLIIISLSFLYIGFVRGTSFEFFEFFVIIYFIYMLKNKNSNITTNKIKSGLYLLVISLVALSIFYQGLINRGATYGGYYISADISFDSTSFISQLSNSLSLIVLILFDYFGFGFFYVSTFFSEIWTSSPEIFLGTLIPSGTTILVDYSIFHLMNSTIDMGARWHPDTMVFIQNYGLIGYFLIVYLLGYSANNISKNINDNNNFIFVYLTLYFILFQMIAFPIGNFVLISSSNQMIVLILFLYWLFKKNQYKNYLN
jgi:hypothetical protein